MSRPLFAIAVAFVAVAACGAHSARIHDLPDCPKAPERGPANEAMGSTRTSRCAQTDDTCGPQPFKQDCLERTTYRPNAPREEVTRLANQTCTFDGECEAPGCDYACVSTRVPEAQVDCSSLESGAKLDGSYCGCIEGGCAWFKQQAAVE